ncbi:hypothetical protein KUV78_03795 [Marinobacter hydrocarbonoclasticus]|uniref:ATP-grasp fold amidoligase family protein n=1 Tax=Marinobacter nauticus TaxID=2743 RepID=UPI001C971B41|nr:ATP-grasp fold amidoligase family protein [Marinobacter nauticus]MBY6192913.1 hypothetical protein [Marinobacter nauticus]MBY6214061.1 hypothetical protein [Marinobacter nauticus]
MPMQLSKWPARIVLAIFHCLLFATRPSALRRYVQITRSLPVFSIPKTYNQKFLWRKFLDHDPRFTVLSDKLACKTWVAERVPDLRIARVLWKSSDPEELLVLPEFLFTTPVAFKSNHGQGDVRVYENGVNAIEQVYRDGKQMLATDHGKANHEWGYFNVPRTLFFEELITGCDCDLSEIKIYTFGDQVRRIVHIGGRFDELWANAWELNGRDELVPSLEKAALANPKGNVQPPPMISQAVDIARKLGSEFDHMRIDLYWDGLRLWLGEVTVYNQAGYHRKPSGNDPNSSLSRAWDIQASYFLQRDDLKGWRKVYAATLNYALTP